MKNGDEFWVNFNVLLPPTRKKDLSDFSDNQAKSIIFTTSNYNCLYLFRISS